MLRCAIKSDAPVIAALHHQTLTTSFLAGLGLNFLNSLYYFLILNEKVWVYEENNEVKGFISYTSNTIGMMKRFLIQKPQCIILMIIKIIIKPSNIIHFAETFKAPFKSKNITYINDMPSGELLSISVNSNCQSSGIGSQLIKCLEEYLQENNVYCYKVIAGAELIGANKFYQKNGFIITTQVMIHGNNKSNLYIKNIQ